MRIYAGIGSRRMPPGVLVNMRRLAASLSDLGWRLATGGADGADAAFAAGAGPRRTTIYLPWPGYNGIAGGNAVVLDYQTRQAAERYAARFHPAWNRCGHGASKLHARNAASCSGPHSTHPSTRSSAGRPAASPPAEPPPGSESPKRSGSPSSTWRCCGPTPRSNASPESAHRPRHRIRIARTLRPQAPETIIHIGKAMPKEQLPMLIGIGAIIVTIATGTCSTNTRITDAVVSINQRMDDGFDNVNRRIDDTNRRMDDGFNNLQRQIDDTNRRIDDVQSDVREIRSMLFETLKDQTPVN